MLNLLSKAVHALGEQYAEWRRRQQAFAELAALDDRSLADIGISRSDIPYVLAQPQAERAARKPANRNYRHAA
jgi:uncharacterized protein YjiS (DUF1127 family)